MAGNAGRCHRANRRPAHQNGTSMGRCAPRHSKTKKRSSQGAACLSGITFDAGGLIALDRKDRRIVALIARAKELGMCITIPATALAQAIRNPARQALLSSLIRQAGTDLVALDGRHRRRSFAGTNRNGRYCRRPCRRVRAEVRADCNHERPGRSQVDRSRTSAIHYLRPPTAPFFCEKHQQNRARQQAALPITLPLTPN